MSTESAVAAPPPGANKPEDAKTGGGKTLLEELERELHDLCQPVTSLQCRLELGRLCGGEEALLEAADGALEDATRIFEAVGRMRERIVNAGQGK